MANTSRINGFRVVKNLGFENNSQTNIYYVASAADEILVGDIVKLGGSADTNGIPSADLAGASDVPCGVIVGIMHSKFDPVGKMNSGSTALDLPAVAQIAVSGAGYILVNDSPNVILEGETSNGTPAAVDVGQNVSHANAARTASTNTSPATIDMGTKNTTSTLNFQLLGFVQRVGNEIGASAKMLVRFNVHQYQSVGTTGV